VVWIQVNNHSPTEIYLTVLGRCGFFYALFNEAVSSSNYTVPNARKIGRQRTGKDMGKCGSNLI
jgi:hypothetical protein